MGFASLLSEITGTKQPPSSTKQHHPTSASIKSNGPNGNSKLQSSFKSLPSNAKSKAYATSSSPHSSIDDDPAVRRLKEARRKEREAKEALNPKKKQTKSSSSAQRSSNSRQLKSTNNSTRKLTTTTPSATIKSRTNSALPIPPKTVSTGPKLSFKDLMKQAETIDKSKLALKTVQNQNISISKPPPSKALQSIKRAERNLEYNLAKPPRRQQQQQQRPRQDDQNRALKEIKPPPKPSFAKPSPELLKRIQAKKKLAAQQQHKPRYSRDQMKSLNKKPSNKDSYGIDAENSDDEDENAYGYYSNDYYDDDNDDDGFIVDDYDNTYNTNDYSREEIWNMFNRGNQSGFNKRHYYDDYDDDMEATGAEIFEEEERTLKQAKLDDKREQLLLEKKAAEKRKRLRK